MKFIVTLREDDVEAYDAERAALEIHRLLQTHRPLVFAVTPSGRGGKTVFVRVQHGEAKRVA
jgi:hypothetical protein